MRSQDKNASLSQQSATIVVFDFDSPEGITHDVGNSVVLRQTLVDERVVRSQQIKNVPVFMDYAVEEQFRFALHRLSQRMVEVGIKRRLRMNIHQVRQMQPLSGKFF